MAKPQEKIRAHKLRKLGKSISEIAHILSVSKGTVSVWCRDVVLTEDQKKNIHEKMIEAGSYGRMLGAEVNKKKKREKIDKYEKVGGGEFKNLTFQERYLIGLGLYWGEGVKTHNSATGFSNSDPQAVLFMKKWFEDSMGVSNDRFTPRVYLNQTHLDKEKVILRFWSNLLELPTSQFGNTVFIKTKNKKVYPGEDTYKGVMLLTVRRGSELKYKILGLIKGLHEEI